MLPEVYLRIKRGAEVGLFGVYDDQTRSWFQEPTVQYGEAVRIMEQEYAGRAGEAGVPAEGREPVAIPEEGVTTECLQSLADFVKRQKETGHHCWIDRGPARDGFGVFVVVGLDGKTTTRSWDRSSGRWH